jgi:hypothetical protein
MNIIYSSDITIENPHELSALCVFYDRVVLPHVAERDVGSITIQLSDTHLTYKALRVVFQKWRWPCLYRPSKGISVHKQANDDVMHLRRFREADRLADQAFDACP